MASAVIVTATHVTVAAQLEADQSHNQMFATTNNAMAAAVAERVHVPVNVALTICFLERDGWSAWPDSSSG